MQPTGMGCIYKRGLLTLPSDIRRAMREASKCRTVTDTDSYAFFCIYHYCRRGDDRGILQIMKNNFILLFAFGLVMAGCTSGKLTVNSVSYQALRTDFAQPEKIDNGAKIAVEYFFNSDGEMQPVVYNLTDDILVVDQTKSFVIKPNGSSVSYYDPTVRTSTTGTYSSETSGSSFNLGGIASALGVGGVLGTLASATTVGSSSTDGVMRQNTVTITDQPLVRVGPKGSIAMSKAYKIEGVGYSSTSRNNIIDIPQKSSGIRFSVCISYSLDDGATYDKIVTNFYESSNITVPVSNKKVSEAFYKIYQQKPDALAESMYMFLIPNNIKRAYTNALGGFIMHSNVYDTYIHGSLIDFQ